MTSGDQDPERLALSPERMRALAHRVADLLVERWAGLADAKIPPHEPRAAARARLAEPLPRTGRPPEEVLERAVRDVLAHAAPTHHPRFFGFIPSPGNFVAVLADALVAGFNPFAGNFVEASGPHELERLTVGWLREALGFPEAASGLFVSGGSMANLTALAAARTARLGGRPDPAARIYLSDQTHGSAQKALRVLGFAREQAVTVPSDDSFRMDATALADAIAADRRAGRRPFAVIATAGTTNTGAVDPLDALAERCAREELWLHVDGAYGAAAALGQRGRALLAGIERADSISLDPHKWLFTPYECGLVLVREGAWLERTFAARADYLDDVQSDEPDLQDQGVQLTRSLRALKVWATFQTFGADAISAAIDGGIARAERVAELVAAMPGWELAAPPSLGICALRAAPPHLEPEAQDELNTDLVRRLAATGVAQVSSTLLHGRRWLRMCPINPRTTDEDLTRTLALLDELARDPAR